MATYADNNVYLKMGGTEVQTYFVEVKLEPSNSANDTTAGAGQDWTMRAAGLNDMKLSISLMYDADNIQTYIQKLKPGQIIEVEYGPEGAVTGKPRHIQTFVLTGASSGVKISKEAVMFEITGEGAAAPTVNMFDGAVYS